MTSGAPGLVLPSYYSYYDSPVKLLATRDGGVCVWRVSRDDGGWREENDLFEEVSFARGGEIFKRTPAEFVQDVERYRADHLTGTGPVFALYETVNAIIDASRREGRSLTLEERALIAGIRRRTFVMFEDQLRNFGDRAADPGIAA
ncbi:hypothetical protein [Micromonospora halophytica]|uniref:hypothetical protein n=1 Tax=Micromonospora halophytica TaxID=47864 RepID=UPI000B805E72|nr:hypothetical protein [Micromonospora halophytica]